MKKANKYWIIVVFCLGLTALFGACNSKADGDPTGVARFAPKDFLEMNKFVVASSDGEGTFVCEDNKLTYRGATYGEGGKTQNEIFYIFETTGGKEFVDGVWRKIADEDVDNYLAVVNENCGLIYNKLSEKQFDKTDTEHIYKVDSETFFKQAFRGKYEAFFGKGYQEEDFTSDFERSSPQLFGNFDKINVTLDCSRADAIVLTIDKAAYGGEEGRKMSYTYTSIGTAQIEIPAEKQSEQVK